MSPPTPCQISFPRIGTHGVQETCSTLDNKTEWYRVDRGFRVDSHLVDLLISVEATLDYERKSNRKDRYRLFFSMVVLYESLNSIVISCSLLIRILTCL